VQLSSNATLPWQGITAPLSIAKWALDLSRSSESVLSPINLEEELFNVEVGYSLAPYARNPETQQIETAFLPADLLFDPTLRVSFPATIGLFVPRYDELCPVSAVSFSSNPNTVLRIGDSFTVSFSSTVAPARVKICGRYQPQPGVNNGIDGQYTFTHTVQAGDEAGACSLMVYVPWTGGTLPVYEQATGFSVPNTGQNELDAHA